MSNPVNLLVLDNDAPGDRELRDFLLLNGYVIGAVRSFGEAHKRILRMPPDLVLLHTEASSLAVAQMCRKLCSVAPRVGIVVVTAADFQEDKVRVLDAGADDYLIKPISNPLLLAKLNTIARRLEANASTQPPVLQIGDLRLDSNRSILERDGVSIPLSPKEFSLASYLMRHSDTPIAHHTLLHAVWGPEHAYEREYLRTYITRLRRKIEIDPDNPRYLVTLPWHGYVFRRSSRRLASEVPLPSKTLGPTGVPADVEQVDSRPGNIAFLNLRRLRNGIRSGNISFPSQVPRFNSQSRPDIQRRMVQLYFVRNWSCPELGRRYGVTMERVRQLLSQWVRRAVSLGYLQEIPPANPKVHEPIEQHDLPFRATLRGPADCVVDPGHVSVDTRSKSLDSIPGASLTSRVY